MAIRKGERKGSGSPAEDAEKRLAAFLAKYAPGIESLGAAIRDEMRNRYPNALELVYDNYNALTIGYGPTERTSDAIFSIALYPRWVSLFFLQAQGLPDPQGLLKGSGSVAKHVILASRETLDHPDILALMEEGVARARVPFDPRSQHRLIIKSVSAKQRPRRPAEEDSQHGAATHHL